MGLAIPGNSADTSPVGEKDALNIPPVPEGFNLQPFLAAQNLGDLLRASTINLVDNPQRGDATVVQRYSSINALQRAVQLEDEGTLNPADGVADYLRDQVRIAAGMLGIDTTDPGYTYLVK